MVGEVIAVTVLKETKKSIFAKDQTAAVVEGTVIHPNGETIPNVTITIAGKSVTTDLKGAFTIPRARPGTQNLCVSYKGRVTPNVGDVEVKTSTIISLEIKLPALEKTEAITHIAAKQWVRLMAVSQNDKNEHISILARIDEQGGLDKSIETYGHLCDVRDGQYIKYPFILRFDGLRGIMDLAGWAKTPQIAVLAIYNKPIATGLSIRRMWEDLGSMEGSDYVIEDIVLLAREFILDSFH